MCDGARDFLDRIQWVGADSCKNKHLTLDVYNGRHYIAGLIKAWRDKDAEALFYRRRSRRIPSNLQNVALRKLRMLHNAATLGDLRVPPANRLEKLKGDREGQWSVRVNDQWRICFEWREGDAYNVEIVDYH